MRRLLLSLVVGLFLLGSYAGEPRSQEKGAKEKAGEALSPSEAKALEAELRGKWEEAANSYIQASGEARINGNLQKAVTYGNKAFETAEKAKDPALQVRAALYIGLSLSYVGAYEQVRQWTDKGIEILKQVPLGPQKESLEAVFYRGLGMSFLRQGEHRKAIEYISYALQVQESVVSYMKRVGAYSRGGALTMSQIVFTRSEERRVGKECRL